MSSIAGSEAKEDISQESYEVLTPRDQEASGEAAETEETQRESLTSLEGLQQRLQRIRPRLDEQGTQGSPTTRANRELTFAQGHQAPPQSQDGQGANMEQPTMMATGVPTVSADAAAMFKTSAPDSADHFKQGSCQYPRSMRGTTPKEILRIKEKAVAPLKVKFRISQYFVSGKFGDEDDEMSPQATETLDALVNTGYRIVEVKRRTKEFDMHNCLLVPAWLDEKGATPAERWDFTKRTHLFDDFGSISKKQITTWCDDCIRWAKTEVAPYERQDQEWIGEFLRNSCVPDLVVQVDRDIELMTGSMQGGVVWAWIMLNKVIHITDEVVVAMCSRIKDFAATGLKGIPGENVMAARAEQLTFATRLNNNGRLPHDAVNDTIKGLSKCSHAEFAKMFDDFGTARKLSLLMGACQLTGTTLEQLQRLWDEAEDQYRSYATANKWTPAQSAHFAKRGRARFKRNEEPPTSEDEEDFEARVQAEVERRLAAMGNDPKSEVDDGNNVDGDEGGKDDEDKSTAGSANTFMGLVARLDTVEKEEEDPEMAVLAGKLGQLLRSCLKEH